MIQELKKNRVIVLTTHSMFLFNAVNIYVLGRKPMFWEIKLLLWLLEDSGRIGMSRMSRL